MKLIKFTSVWCMSCIIMNQMLVKLFKEYNIEVIDYDFDLDKNKVSEYNVGEILPVLIFVDEKGHEVKRVIGEVSKKELINVFEEVGVDRI